MDERGKEIERWQARYETQRALFETYWNEVAERVDPAAANFITRDRSPGEKRTEKLFDSTATIALGRGQAAFESMVTPRTQKWHNLKAVDPALSRSQPVRAYLEDVRDLLFSIRYATTANFANQNSEFIRSFLAYGNAVMYVDEDKTGRGLRYRCYPLAECYFAEDAHGMVDTVHRRFKLTARQLGQFFPNAKFSQSIREAIERGETRDFHLLHCVKPNDEVNPRRRDYRGMPISSYYFLKEQGEVIEEGGYTSMPYIVSRYRVHAGEVYGRGPAMDVLPAIKTLNEQQKTNLRAGQRMADPPLIASDDGALAPFNMRGGSINYGYMDDQGRALIQPLQMASNLPVALEMQEREAGVVRDAFFITLFQILTEGPQMTATEVLQRMQEKGVLMSPPVGRLQSEGYGKLIERELDLVSRLAGGAFMPEMPMELMEAGGTYEVQYDAPINRAQRAEEGVAILETINIAASLAQFDPGALKVIKAKESLRALAEIKGFPARLLASEDEIEEAEAAEAEAAQLQSLLAAAPIVADSAKNLAQAEALAGGAPRVLPGAA